MIGGHRFRELTFSYAGQVTNLIVGAAMLPLILFYLDESQFVVWGVFTAIAGIMLQCEVAIQGSVNRRIARIEASRPELLLHAFKAARRLFRRFSTLAFTFLLFAGGLYVLLSHPGGRLPLPEWILYVAAFGLSYAFGHNAAYLVGRERASTLNLNNIRSRLCNLALVIPLLYILESVWALVFAFAISVAVSIFYNQRSAAKMIAEDSSIDTQEAPTQDDPILHFRLGHIVGYAAFLMLSFWVYRSLLLLDVAAGADLGRSASFALSLQLFALGMSVAMVPVVMRVAPLARLLATDRDMASIEFARLHCLSLAGLVAFALMALALGQLDFSDFGIVVDWPSAGLILLLSVAFAIELTLQAIASVMVNLSRFEFAKYYIASVSVSLTIGWIALIAKGSLLHAIGAMLLVQTLVALPLMWRQMSREIGIGLRCYLQILRRLPEQEYDRRRP